MQKTQLTKLLTLIAKAYAGANFANMFDEPTRATTYQHRKDNIATPLEEAAAMVKVEIERADAKVSKRRRKKSRTVPRLPYKDD